MPNDRGVTTTESLKSGPEVSREIAQEVAEEMAEVVQKTAEESAKQAKQAVTMDYSKADSIVFWHATGRRCEISCGTDPETKERLLMFYLRKTIMKNGVPQRVFYASPPPTADKGPPRFECFVINGTGDQCGAKHWQATKFLAHLRGFHRQESTDQFPQVIEALQVESQREIQPDLLKQLGLGAELEPFENQGEAAPELHWCKANGYPDCERFFDSPDAMYAHQRGHKGEEKSDGQSSA